MIQRIVLYALHGLVDCGGRNISPGQALERAIKVDDKQTPALHKGGLIPARPLLLKVASVAIEVAIQSQKQ